MADFSSYIVLIVIGLVVLLALLVSVIESYRKDLMAKGHIMFMLATLLLIIGLITFFFIYVLGPAATAGG